MTEAENKIPIKGYCTFHPLKHCWIGSGFKAEWFGDLDIYKNDKIMDPVKRIAEETEEDYQALKGDSFWKYITKQASSFRDEDFSAGWIRGNDAPAEGQNNFGGALIKGKYKIINMPQERLGSFTEWRLYNLDEDPGENNDLAKDYPDIVNDLVNTLQSDWP